MKLIMLRTAHGSPEGHTTLTYHEGREYEVPQWLGEHFFEIGAAKLPEEEIGEAEEEIGEADGAPAADGEPKPPKRGRKAQA